MDYDMSRRGWFSAAESYADAVAGVSNYPYAYVYATFLTLSGHLLGRRTSIRYATPIYPNYYTCLVGDSSITHKSTAMSLGIESMRGVSDIPPTRNVTTQQGLLQAMLTGGGRALLWLDEMAALLSKKRQDFAADLLSRIVELYSCPSTAGNYTRYDPIVVENIFLTILSGSTIEWLQSYLTASDLMAGFGNRMVFVLGDPRQEKDWPPPPDWSEFKWTPILDFEGEVQLDEQARDVWAVFYNKFTQVQIKSTPFARTMAARIPEKILKTVLVMCAWLRDNVAGPSVVDAAIDWGRYLHTCIQRLSPAFEQPERQGLAVIKEGCDTGPHLFDRLSHIYSGTRIKEALNNLKWLGVITINGDRYEVIKGVGAADCRTA